MLPSVPAILVSGLSERQSKTASVADAAAQTLRHLGLIFILWLSESHDLLVTQGHHGIDAHCPARRHIAGHQNYSNEQSRDRCKGCGVGCRHTE